MGITQINAGRFTVRGRSLGGFYTGLHVPELDALFDAGTALRTGASSSNLFLSHAHADHMGSLPALLGMRGLTGIQKPLRLFAPRETIPDLVEALERLSTIHRWSLAVETVPMAPGDEFQVKGNLFVRAIRTLHPVPSLGYVFFHRVQKLKAEFAALPGHKIRDLRLAGDDIFVQQYRLVLAYATDTLPEVFRQNPDLYEVPVLIVECTFLDERKSVKAARAGCHIHLDELLPLMPRLQNSKIVLMHFSQIYSPVQVREIFQRRCPVEFQDRFELFLPDGDRWWD